MGIHGIRHLSDNGLCLAELEGSKTYCKRQLGHDGAHQGVKEAILPNADGTDFSDWGHVKSIEW